MLHSSRGGNGVRPSKISRLAPLAAMARAMCMPTPPRPPVTRYAASSPPSDVVEYQISAGRHQSRDVTSIRPHGDLNLAGRGHNFAHQRGGISGVGCVRIKVDQSTPEVRVLLRDDPASSPQCRLVH